MKELAALKEKIPVLKEFFIGRNIARRTHGFQYGEIAVFEKKEDPMHYEKHPEHEKLVRKILPKLEIGNGPLIVNSLNLFRVLRMKHQG